MHLTLAFGGDTCSSGEFSTKFQNINDENSKIFSLKKKMFSLKIHIENMVNGLKMSIDIGNSINESFSVYSCFEIVNNDFVKKWTFFYVFFGENMLAFRPQPVKCSIWISKLFMIIFVNQMVYKKSTGHNMCVCLYTNDDGTQSKNTHHHPVHICFTISDNLFPLIHFWFNIFLALFAVLFVVWGILIILAFDFTKRKIYVSSKIFKS